MSSAKVSSGVPVGTPATTALNKLSGMKYVAASSKPVQETVVSTDVGTTTDHHLPNTPEDVNYFPFEEKEDNEVKVQGKLSVDASVVFDDGAELFAVPVPLNVHETLQHINTYENNMEAGAGVKKSTKAFG